MRCLKGVSIAPFMSWTIIMMPRLVLHYVMICSVMTMLINYW